MKRFFGILMSMVMVFSTVGAIGASADDGISVKAYDYVIAEGNFDGLGTGFDFTSADNVLYDYSSNAKAAVVDSPLEDDGHGLVAQITKNSNYDSIMGFMWKAIDPDYVSNTATPTPDAETAALLNNVKIEIDVCLGAKMKGVIQYTSYTNPRTSPSLLTFEESGKAQLGNGTSNFEYELNTWYNVVMYLNFDELKYSGYVINEETGETVLANENITLPTSNNSTNAALNFRMYVPKNTNDGSIYVDNMRYSVPKIFSDEITATLISDGFDSGIGTAYTTNGYVYSADDTIAASTHGKVAVVNSKESEEGTTYTASSLMTANTLVNPKYSTALLTGDNLKQAKNAVIKLDTCFYDMADASIQLAGQSAANKSVYTSLIDFTSDGKIILKDGTTVEYAKNTWYSFEIGVDFTANNYYVKKNGDLMKANIALPLFANRGAHIVAAGLALRETDTEAQVAVDNLELALKGYKEQAGFFKTEQENGLTRLNYVTMTKEDVAKNTSNDIFVGKNLIEQEDFVNSSNWNRSSTAISEISTATKNSANHGKVIKFSNFKTDGSIVSNQSVGSANTIVNPEQATDNWNAILSDTAELAKYQKVVLNASLYVPNYSNFAIDVLRLTGKNTRTNKNFLKFTSSGEIQYLSTATVYSTVSDVKYIPGMWYDFVLEFDYVNHKYKAYMIDESGNVTTLTENGVIPEDFVYGLAYRVIYSNNSEKCTMEIDDWSFYTGTAALSTATAYSGERLIIAEYDSTTNKLVNVNSAVMGTEDYDLVSIGYDTDDNVDRYYMVWSGYDTLVPATEKLPLE